MECREASEQPRQGGSWHSACASLPAGPASIRQEAGGAVGGATQPPLSLCFDASNLRPDEWFEALRTYYAGLIDICPRDERLPTSPPRASAKRVGTIVASSTNYPALSFRRDRTQIEQTGNRLILRQLKSGRVRSVLDGEPFELRPREFYLFDAMRPFYGIGDAAANLTVSIPHDAIGYEPTCHPARFSLPADTPAGRLLDAGVETLFAQAQHASADDGAVLAAGFVALLRGLLFPADADDAARSAVEQSRAAAVRRYVDAHLTDPAISAEQVGRVVGASRATVYRVFASEGGFERAVLDRRLRAATSELSRTPPRRGAIVAVADRWGFHDPARFTRLCRQRFGCLPSDILGLAAPAGQPPMRRSSEVAVPSLSSLYE